MVLNTWESYIKISKYAFIHLTIRKDWHEHILDNLNGRFIAKYFHIRLWPELATAPAGTGAEVPRVAVPTAHHSVAILIWASGTPTNIFPGAHDFPSLKNSVLVYFLSVISLC